jgi:hypothetical protein
LNSEICGASDINELINTGLLSEHRIPFDGRDTIRSTIHENTPPPSATPSRHHNQPNTTTKPESLSKKHRPTAPRHELKRPSRKEKERGPSTRRHNARIHHSSSHPSISLEGFVFFFYLVIRLVFEVSIEVHFDGTDCF